MMVFCSLTYTRASRIHIRLPDGNVSWNIICSRIRYAMYVCMSQIEKISTIIHVARIVFATKTTMRPFLSFFPLLYAFIVGVCFFVSVPFRLFIFNIFFSFIFFF